ncbi:hypothetical protein EV1_032932 [Malus domestica]
MKPRLIKSCSSVLWRPICFLFVLGLSCYMISMLFKMTKRIEHRILFESHEALNRSFSSIDSTSKLLTPLNPSAFNLARSLTSSLNGTELNFTTIQTTVVPTLFLALSTIPHISQVSYIGLDGLSFSLNNYADQTYAVFSNASFSSNWYTQPVNRDTGKLYGTAVASDSKVIVNASWFQAALNSTSGYSLLGRGWDKAQGSLFISTVVMDGRGVISLGIPAKVVVDHFAALDFHGGYFHLATADGDVIVQSKLPKTQFQISNNTVSVQTVKPNGNVTSNLGHFPCNIPDDDDKDNDGSNGGKLGSSYSWKLKGTKYRAYCSTLEIIGVRSVYVLTCPANGLANVDHKSVVLLGILLFIILVSVCIFIFLIIRAAGREMILCARIIKQEGVTRQAERKSMNKTKAFSRASHDVRASLAAITGLIELCHQDANPDSELAANLAQMDTCTNDLLGILNSVLDISKIEAGKVQLEIEEFNLAQLLEDVVDMFYPIAIKKGVDIVLDPCDDSIVKTCNVRGYRGKLKQIMCNLLSNAVKFTSEGHITVRAMVPKTSYENEIKAETKGSHVVLFIEGDERRKILVKYISRLNIKVSYVKYAKNLLPQLEKIKRKLDISYFNYSEKSQQGIHDQLSTSAFKYSDSRASDGSHSTKEEDGHTCRKINSRNSPASIVLVVIDTNGGAFSELYTTMASFRKDIHNSRCKVVWLDSSITRNMHPLQMEGCSLAPPNDYIIYKPFHGSRLYKVLGLLPELKRCNLPELETRKQDQEAQQIELELATNESGMSSSLQQVTIHKCVEKKSDQELLHGKKVLVVDDDGVTRKVIASSLQRLGAVVEVLENGKEAFEQVFKALSDHSKKGHTNSTLYDYIFMDFQMPIMDGFAATRLIRMEEKQYGIHLRIIALTCHAVTEEVSKTLEAGIHLTKPFKMDKFMRVIKSFEDNQN